MREPILLGGIRRMKVNMSKVIAQRSENANCVQLTSVLRSIQECI